jgi:hypothetical protein
LVYREGRKIVRNLKDWENEFTANRVTLGGETVDAAGFAQTFEVTDGGQTLSYRPGTSFTGGDLLFGESWSNGLPGPGIEAVVAADGFNSETVFGFDGTIINHTDGTIASVDGFNFIRGDTWNMSGGRLSARYVLSNGQFSDATTINISGGLVDLTDVEGNQHMGAANGGAFNVSGSAVLDGTQATLEVQTAGTVNIASDWTGEWIWGIYSGNEWRDLFLGGLITFDGGILTEEQFEANFEVSPDGTILSRPSGPPIIIAFTYNPDNTVTLTWESRPSAEAGYSLLFSSDLSVGVENWPDENDSIRTGGDTTTYTTQTTFPGPKTFFVIVAN